MLLWCPTCGGDFEPGRVQPGSGTAVCAKDGEVRPRIARPPLGEVITPRTGAGWTAQWSQRSSSSYRFEVKVERAFATLSAAEWGAIVEPAGLETLVAGLLLSVPLFPITRIPTLFAPRIVIGPRLVRFGPRFRRRRVLNGFVVRERGWRSWCLSLDENLGEPLDVLDCARAGSELVELRDVLNEALVVVGRAPEAGVERGTAYRG